MFGIGTTPLAGPLLIALFAVWGRLFWHELRTNRVSLPAIVVLVALLIAWLYVTAPRGFF